MTVHTSSSGLPDLPLMCLKTADMTSTTDAVRGHNTVIDFWTTKCTRCPDALDKLNAMALATDNNNSQNNNIKFVSICCGTKLDDAREVLEAPKDEPRWSHLSHYYMEFDDKEKAKKSLGFQQVPYYVVVDDSGSIVQKGSSHQVDLEHAMEAANHNDDDKENQQPPQDTTTTVVVKVPETLPLERVFNMDDDF